MPTYQLRYERDAKTNLAKNVGIYGPDFASKFGEWTSQIVSDVASTSPKHSSLVTSELLRDIHASEATVNEAFATKGAFSPAKYLMSFLRLRRAPVEIRCAQRTFELFGQPVEILAVFFVDHAAKTVVFHRFEGFLLPSPDHTVKPIKATDSEHELKPKKQSLIDLVIGHLLTTTRVTLLREPVAGIISAGIVVGALTANFKGFVVGVAAAYLALAAISDTSLKEASTK